MVTEFHSDPIFEAEAALHWASLDEDIGSVDYDRQLRNEHAVAMIEQLERLEQINRCGPMLPGIRQDIDVIIATMRRIMPALD